MATGEESVQMKITEDECSRAIGAECIDKIVTKIGVGRGMTRLVLHRILLTSVVKSVLEVSALRVLTDGVDWATGMIL